MAPDKILGIFGDAELSARGPRPCFQIILMISRGVFETFLCQANYLQAQVALPTLTPITPQYVPTLEQLKFLTGQYEEHPSYCFEAAVLGTSLR